MRCSIFPMARRVGKVADLVVTVPKPLWTGWLEEGDLPGTPPTGEEWAWFIGGHKPDAGPGDRLYVVAHGRLRGYAPITRVVRAPNYPGKWAICREAGAVACTVPETIKGFQGWRRRWWDRLAEVSFPDWMTEGVPLRTIRSGVEAVG